MMKYCIPLFFLRVLSISFAMLFLLIPKVYPQDVGGEETVTVQTESNNTSDTVAVGNNRTDSYSIEMPEVLYKTPEATAFQKYGEYDVSEFTGTPSIQVPVYTLKYKDVEIPIVLTYDASGIMVDQEASWVGLGWNLMVGGCINYVVSGSKDPDILLASYSDWEGLLSQGNGDFYYQESNLDTYGSSIITDFHKGYGERDYYQVCLPGGRSLSFHVNPRTCKCEVFGKDADQYKIEDINNSLYSTLSNARWVITDGDGWVYYFDPGEKATNTNTYVMYTSTWNLTRIVSPEGSVVDFGHTRPLDLIHSRSQLYEQYDCLSELNTSYYPCVGYTGQLSATFYDVSPTYLSYMETYDQFVSFSTSARNDFPGSRKLDKITVRSKLSNDTIREVILSYDYFTASITGGNYLTFSTYSGGSDELELRLKLLSVKECGENDTLTTSFTYNETVPLPIKTSYSRDFWGYYNGNINGGTNISQALYTMLPTPLPILLASNNAYSSTYRRMKAANRYCDPVKSQAAILTGITYPTKGSTNFEYEPHCFSTSGTMPSVRFPTSQGYLSHVLNQSVMDYNHTGNVTYRIFTIEDKGEGTISVDFYGRLSDLMRNGAYVRIYPHNPNGTSTITYDLSSLSGIDLNSTYSYSATFDLSLTSNTYTVVAYCPDALGDDYGVSASVSLHKNFTSTSVPVSYGGGLRIRKMTRLDETGAVCDSTVYVYLDEAGNTNGVLLRPLTFFNSRQVWCIYRFGPLPGQVNGYLYNVHRLRLPSCDMPAQFLPMGGGTVGYSAVTQRLYDSNGELQGTVTSCYTDSVPTSYRGKLWYFNCHGNGNLLSRTYTDASGNLLKRNTYTYNHITHRNRVNVIMEDSYINTSGEGGSFQTQTPRYKLWFYPFVKDWDWLSSETETLYGVGGMSSVTTTYTYCDINHRIKSATTDTSDSELAYVTQYLYPSDFAQGPENAMTDSANFIINPVVGQSLSSKRGTVTTLLQSRRDHYSLLSGYSRDLLRNVFLRTSSDFSFGEGTPEKRLIYSYTPSCDLRYVEKDTIEKVVYLWGYHQMYPVAEIRGATFGQVSQWVNPTFITQIGNAVGDIPTKLATLRSLLSDKGVLVTTCTYAPLFGVTTSTAPNNTKRQYSYDAFGRLSSTSDGSGNILDTYQYHYKP